MKGLTFITNKTTGRQYAQIVLQEVTKHGSKRLEDFIDVIIAEARKDEKSVPWEKIKKELK